MPRGTAIPFTLGLVFLLAANAQAQNWRPADDSSFPRHDVLRVIEPDGAVLEARGDRVVRLRGSSVRELGCTAREGTGVIRALAIGPLGTTYVAGERGLYLVDPDVEVVDPVRLSDGAPRGEILSLHSDRADRLWLLTQAELGCVHTSQWFGRVHTRDDGLPPPPYLELAAAGAVLYLRTADGVFAYRPDPSIPELLEVRAPGPTVENRVECLLRASASGSATFRCRAASEHMLREIRAGWIEFAYPGNHELAIHAFDRDLDRSAAAPLAVHVPYPKAYDPRRLPLLIAAFAAIVVVGFAARTLRAKRPIGKALLEAGLVLVIGLQVLAAVLGHGRSYPFIGFGMYREVRNEGDVVYTPLVRARDRNGEWREIPAGPLSFATDGKWRHLAELCYADEQQLETFLTERRVALGTPWTAIELRISRRRLTEAGPIDVAPYVLLRHEAARTAK